MIRSIAVAALAALTLAFAACRSPAHVGDGEFGKVRVAPGLDTGFLYLSPGDEVLLLETRGTPEGTVIVYRPDMSTWGTEHRRCEAMAISRTKPEVACLDGDTVRFLRVPDLVELGSTPEPEGALFDRGTRIVPAPPGAGYVFVTSRPGRMNIHVWSADERAFTKSGRSALDGTIRAAAIDDRTGLLVLVGEGKRVEIYDLVEMKSTGTLDLPANSTSFGVVARNGVAWVGTTNGRIVPVELKTRTVGEPVGLGGPGDVFLNLSGTGRFLAAASQDRAARRPPYATNLKVFYIDGDRLTEIADSFLETRGELVDLAMLETTETVALSTTWDLLAWRYSPR